MCKPVARLRWTSGAGLLAGAADARGSRALHPLPPGPSKGETTRYVDIREGDDPATAQMADWVRQAAALPGFLAPPV